jgi:hypothetical protein
LSAVAAFAPAAPRVQSDESIWDAVERLIDRAPTLDDLRRHRLELFYARRLREQGLPVPAELQEEERKTEVAGLVVRPLLERVRAAYDEPVLVLKGPDVANAYPDPALRPFHDLDLLVADAAAAHRALLDAGFRCVGEPSLYVGIHHLQPMIWPGLPVHVELHSRPKWVEGLEPPSAEALLERAEATNPELAGALSLPPAELALVLAAHGWAHEPLWRLRDVVDVAAVALHADRGRIDALAREWGIERMWRTTIRVAEALFFGESQPLSLRSWARHLPRVRERSVLEMHLERWLSGFAAYSRRRALRLLPSILLDEIRPTAGETWGSKLRRTGHALRHLSWRRGEHNEVVARRGHD